VSSPIRDKVAREMIWWRVVVEKWWWENVEVEH